MSKRVSAGELLRKLLIPHTTLHLIMAVVLSLLTVFSVARQCGWLTQIEQYKEFSVTFATWTAVNKTAELNIMNLLLFGLPIVFVLYGLLLNLWQPVCDRAPIAELLPIWIICQIWLDRFSVSTVLMAVLIAFAAFWLLVRQKQSCEDVRDLLLTILLHQYTAVILMQCLYAGLGLQFAAVLTEPFCLVVLWLDFLLVLLQGFRPSASRIAALLRSAQLLLPLSFCYAWRFPCETEDGITFLYPSVPWMLFCFCIAGILLAMALYHLIKKKPGIWCSTMVSATAALVYCLPNPSILTDWFHYGEYAIPTQQLLSYGSLPYFDFYPIHGLCDYVYSGTAALFFDHSFAALSPGVVCGNLLIACGAALLVRWFSQDKTAAFLLFQSLLYPTVFAQWGYNYIVRWIFAFLTLFILNSPKIRASAIASLYAFIWLSILGILWNPSIGGVLAIAFLPVLVLRFARKEGREELASLKQKENRLPWIRRAIPLLIVGLCYIPLFLHIVQYILENTGTTTETNGSAMLKETDLASVALDPEWLKKFGALIFVGLFLLLLNRLRDRKARLGTWEALLFTLCCTPLLANYIYVRYDGGDRAVYYWMMLAVCVALPLLFSLLRNAASIRRKQHIMAATGAILCIAFTMCNLLPVCIPDWQVKRTAYDADAVYIDGDALGIPKLGSGYLPGTRATRIQNYAELCQAVCTDPEDSVFNGTIYIAMTMMMDQKLPTRYTSLYNISNSTMQQIALEELKANPPKLVLLQNGTLIDEMTTSLRSFSVYEWLLTEGYVPYTYKDLLFMTKSTDLPEQALPAWRTFIYRLTQEDLQMLPIVWAQSEAAKTLMPISASIQSSTNNLRAVLRTDLTFDQPISGRESDFLQLTISGLSGRAAGTVSFVCNTHEIRETISMDFIAQDGTLLIPLAASPGWFLTEDHTTLTIRLEADDTSVFSKDAALEATLLHTPD